MSLAAATLRIRIAEAAACTEAVAENNFARQILAARRRALQDALSEVEGAAGDSSTPSRPRYFGDMAVAQMADEAIEAMHAEDDAAQAAETPQPAATVPAGDNRVAPSDPVAGSGQPSPEPDEDESPVYTRARIELLRELWPSPDHTLDDIRTALNSLRARAKVASVDALGMKARSLGLAPRHGVAITDAQRAARQQSIAKAREARAARRAEPPRERTHAERRDQARALLRDGYGESQVATRTGLEIAEVQAILADAEHQARQMLTGGMSSDEIVAATGIPPRRVRELREGQRAAA